MYEVEVMDVNVLELNEQRLSWFYGGRSSDNTPTVFSNQCAHSALTAVQQQLYCVDIDPLHKCPLDFFISRVVRDTFSHTHNRWQLKIHLSTLKHGNTQLSLGFLRYLLPQQ